jgi:hypothetical protein
MANENRARIKAARVELKERQRVKRTGGGDVQPRLMNQKPKRLPKRFAEAEAARIARADAWWRGDKEGSTAVPHVAPEIRGMPEYEVPQEPKPGPPQFRTNNVPSEARELEHKTEIRKRGLKQCKRCERLIEKKAHPICKKCRKPTKRKAKDES